MHNLILPKAIKFKDYHLSGVSNAGIGTCITIPEWKICFDVAQGLPFAFSMKNFLISHLHQDHAAGIPYLISQKAMMSHPAPNFYIPPGTGDDLQTILETWQRLEGHTYEYSLTEVQPEKQYELGKTLSFKSFQTKHRVNCNGYTLFRKNKKLNEKYKDLSREEIRSIVESGENVEHTFYKPKVSFTGDTQIEFLDLSPDVQKSETLIMEVTYYDDKKPIESAKKWGHIHFDEVVERIPKIEAKNIVWIHMSARYTKKYAKELIEKHLPEHKDRIHLL